MRCGRLWHCLSFFSFSFHVLLPSPLKKVDGKSNNAWDAKRDCRSCSGDQKGMLTKSGYDFHQTTRHHSPATTISGCWLPNIRRRLTGRSWEAVLRPAFLARLSSHLQKRLEICSWPLCCRVLCGWAPWANIGALRLVNCGQYHCTPCFKLRSIRCKFLMQVSFAYVTLLGSKWPLNFQ